MENMLSYLNQKCLLLVDLGISRNAHYYFSSSQINPTKFKFNVNSTYYFIMGLNILLCDYNTRFFFPNSNLNVCRKKIIEMNHHLFLYNK